VVEPDDSVVGVEVVGGTFVWAVEPVVSVVSVEVIDGAFD
jgi:hypothetical protein